MNITSTLLISILALAGTSVASAQSVIRETKVVTPFGANATTDDSWTYTAGTSRLAGTEGLGFLLYGEPSTANFSAVGSNYTTPVTNHINGIQVTANVLNVANAPVNGFTVFLLDAQDDSVSAVFNWVDFIGGATVTVEFDPNVNPAFDYNNVVFWNLVGGSSNSPIDVTLGNISGVVLQAIPEPSTAAAVAGLAVLGFVASRRRRQA